SAAGEDGRIQPFEGDTAIFITPGYRFKAIDGLITNFHLPRSTLFMLVSALTPTPSAPDIAFTVMAMEACCCRSAATTNLRGWEAAGRPMQPRTRRDPGRIRFLRRCHSTRRCAQPRRSGRA